MPIPPRTADRVSQKPNCATRTISSTRIRIGMGSPGFEGCHQARLVELLGTQLHPGLLEPIARNLHGELLLPRLLKSRLTGPHDLIFLTRHRSSKTPPLVLPAT